MKDETGIACFPGRKGSSAQLPTPPGVALLGPIETDWKHASVGSSRTGKLFVALMLDLFQIMFQQIRCMLMALENDST